MNIRFIQTRTPFQFAYLLFTFFTPKSTFRNVNYLREICIMVINVLDVFQNLWASGEEASSEDCAQDRVGRREMTS